MYCKRTFSEKLVYKMNSGMKHTNGINIYQYVICYIQICNQYVNAIINNKYNGGPIFFRVTVYKSFLVESS